MQLLDTIIKHKVKVDKEKEALMYEVLKFLATFGPGYEGREAMGLSHAIEELFNIKLEDTYEKDTKTKG